MNKKSQSLKGGILFILIAMAIFGFVMFYRGGISGNMVGITGMVVEPQWQNVDESTAWQVGGSIKTQDGTEEVITSLNMLPGGMVCTESGCKKVSQITRYLPPQTQPPQTQPDTYDLFSELINKQETGGAQIREYDSFPTSDERTAYEKRMTSDKKAYGPYQFQIGTAKGLLEDAGYQPMIDGMIWYNLLYDQEFNDNLMRAQYNKLNEMFDGNPGLMAMGHYANPDDVIASLELVYPKKDDYSNVDISEFAGLRAMGVDIDANEILINGRHDLNNWLLVELKEGGRAPIEYAKTFVETFVVSAPAEAPAAKEWAQLTAGEQAIFGTSERYAEKLASATQMMPMIEGQMVMPAAKGVAPPGWEHLSNDLKSLFMDKQEYEDFVEESRPPTLASLTAGLPIVGGPGSPMHHAMIPKEEEDVNYYIVTLTDGEMSKTVIVNDNELSNLESEAGRNPAIKIIEKSTTINKVQRDALQNMGDNEIYNLNTDGTLEIKTNPSLKPTGKERTKRKLTIESDGSSVEQRFEQQYSSEGEDGILMSETLTTIKQDKDGITRETATARTLYDENGNIISRESEGTIIVNGERQTFRSEFKKDKEGVIPDTPSRTTYWDASGRPIKIVDAELGTAEWKWTDKEKGEGEWDLSGAEGGKKEELEKLAKKKEGNYVWGTAIKDILGALQTHGVGRFVGLFMDDDTFEEWREDVDEFFCKTIIGGDINCWTSKLCSAYSELTGEGYVSVESPSGILELAAHVEGERTTMRFANETGRQNEYIYKLSMMVQNPENTDEDMEFNVYLYGSRVVKLYENDIIIEEGESFQRIGAGMVVQYSPYFYDKICIKFADDLTIDGGRSVDEVCNTINEYPGGPVAYETAVEVTESGGEGTDNSVNQAETDF